LKRHWGGRRGGSKGAQTTNPRIVMGGVQCPLCHDGDERRDSGGDLATVGKAIGERGERVGITSRTLSAVGWGASGETAGETKRGGGAEEGGGSSGWEDDPPRNPMVRS